MKKLVAPNHYFQNCLANLNKVRNLSQNNSSFGIFNLRIS